MSNDEDSKCSSSSSVSGKGLYCNKKEGYEESHIKDIGGKLENGHIEDEDDDDRSPMEWSDDEDSILNHLNKAAHKNTKRKRPVGPFELTFKCEWKGCSFETDEDSKFHVHVSYHIPDVEIKTLGNGDEVYMCLWADCTYLTGGAKEIQRHVTYHSYHTKLKNIGEKIVQEWKLPDCMYGKETRNLIPDKIDGMFCEWKDCNKEFNNVQLFLYHIHMHVNECFMTSDSKQEMFRCKWKGCSRGGSMPTRVRLVDHMRTHTRERVVACPTCGHVFSTNTKLSDHCHRQLPTELSEFQCSHCYKNFPSLRLLKDHMRGHVNFYKCCYCDMTCFSRHTFSAHIRYKHLDSKPFKCSLCKYACKTQYDLKTHLTSHDPDSRLGCEEDGCEFSCRSKQTLQRHMIEQHQVSASSTYCCHLCDSRFKRGCYLTKHLMTKHCLRWPSGHSRFMYQRQEDGNFRLQTVRYESVKLYGENSHNTTTPSKNNFKVTPITMNGSASFKVSSIEPDSSSGVSQVFISIEDESGNTINCVTAPEVVGDEIPKYATVIASAAETSETSAETSAETAMETCTAAESCSDNNAEAVVENVGQTNGGTGTESSSENVEENCNA